MLTEECLAKIGKLFIKAQYEKCEKSLIKCLSDDDENHEATQINEPYEDLCKCSGESSSLLSSCSTIFRCIFQQNDYVCTSLCENIKRKSGNDEIKYPCGRLSSLLQDMQGWAVSEHHLDVELIILHNYLITLLSHHVSEMRCWSENAFTLISMTLNRAFEVRTGSVASVHRPVAEEIVSLIDGILLHTKNMSEFSLKSFSELCYSIFYFLMIRKVLPPVHCVERILSKMEQVYKRTELKKCRRPGFVCLHPTNLVTPGIPPHKDLLQLLLACSSLAIKDVHAAYSHLERITYSGWEHFIGYMKAFLLFKEKQYDQALEYSWSLWRSIQKAENLMVSRLSNFIGCCLFKKGCFSMSLKWFQKSTNSDFSYLLPLWNMACAFKSLGKNSASIAILEILEKGSLVSLDKHDSYLFCNHLRLGDQPEITHVQALYLLAHQCLSFCHFAQSAKHFSKLLDLLKEKQLEDVLQSVHFSFSLLDTHVEACYAYLQTGMYDECLKSGKSAVEYFPASNSRKQSESAFSWNTSKKPRETSNFNHCTKNSLLVEDFGLLDFLPFSNHSTHLGQNYMEQKNSLYLKNRNEATSLKTKNSAENLNTDKEVQDQQFSHDHIKPHYILHLMIEASAKYSLHSAVETEASLRRALTATMQYQERAENSGISSLSKDQDYSFAKSEDEACSVCLNLISSLRSQIYNNLAVLSISKGHFKEAAHNFRIAIMHDSNNVDTVYNYCLLQIQLQQVEAAQAFWEASKLRSGRIKSILVSDDDCDSTCTVTTDLLKSLNEAFSTEA